MVVQMLALGKFQTVMEITNFFDKAEVLMNSTYYFFFFFFIWSKKKLSGTYDRKSLKGGIIPYKSHLESVTQCSCKRQGPIGNKERVL